MQKEKLMHVSAHAVDRVSATLNELAKKEPETAELVAEVLRRAFAPRRPTTRQKRYLSPYHQASTGPWRD